MGADPGQNRPAVRRAEEKIKILQELIPLLEEIKKRGEKVVFTNGCFDLLHAGHATYLEEARLLGDCLVVGLNSDASVQKIKDPPRPILPEAQRALVLASLEAVDFVILFEDSTPLALIRALKPNILVKGADWEEAEIVGGKDMMGWGGEIRRIPVVSGISTTAIIERIFDQHKK